METEQVGRRLERLHAALLRNQPAPTDCSIRVLTTAGGNGTEDPAEVRVEYVEPGSGSRTALHLTANGPGAVASEYVTRHGTVRWPVEFDLRRGYGFLGAQYGSEEAMARQIWRFLKNLVD